VKNRKEVIQYKFIPEPSGIKNQYNSKYTRDFDKMPVQGDEKDPCPCGHDTLR
jgi:hypothetical protein